MAIEDLIFKLSNNPGDPYLNYEVALEYERLNQTASAVSFFLRTVEYGEVFNGFAADIQYASLLKIAHCLADQIDRVASVKNVLFQALTVRADRPEAYFLLSQFYERQGDWQECYSMAYLGYFQQKEHQQPKLDRFVGYYDDYCLEFQMAVSAWWIGRKAESKELFKKLSEMDLAPEYMASVEDNLARIASL